MDNILYCGYFGDDREGVVHLSSGSQCPQYIREEGRIIIGGRCHCGSGKDNRQE